ncbi:uncharacterized protein LOC103133341 [Poecilia formosa]|uniref:uncharacterized protein LOC103133341 n=1 Tax=Poecilia formosa TaxID=48698 RepID=UPI0007BAC947|nr:PREDICTED: uncharacterized protein LOC103133341 [Poecilia formosa]
MNHPTFNKDLILLPRSTWKNICKHKTKRRLHEGGCIISAFEINKSWDYKTVIFEIKEAFKDKIPDDTSVELLMPCGSNLVQPRLRDGQELNGFMIHKIFRAKSMYIRPSTDLPLSFEHTDSEESSMELDAASTSSHHSTNIPSQRSDDMNTTARGNLNSLTQDSNYPPTRRTTIIQSSEIPPESTDSLTSANQLSAAQPETIDSVSTVHQTSDSCDNYATYISLMSSISDLSSDEEELNLAIMASLQNDVVSDDPNARSAKEILLELASQIDASQRCRFNINRSSVLDGALRGFRRLSYNPRYQMCIKFSDDLGLHEEAVDLGGPKREFLHLLMEAIAQSPMFEGRDGNLNLALNSSALREDRYFFAGQAIAVSLVNGGPPPGFFSSALYSRLIGGSSAVKPVLNDIADNDLHDKIQKVSECTSVEELIKATEPLHDYLANSGCLRQLKTINDKDLLVQDILMFQVVHRVTGAFERFVVIVMNTYHVDNLFLHKLQPLLLLLF